MTRIRSLSIAGIWALCLGGLLGAQVGVIPAGPQPRDLGAQQPAERRIPVGTSLITGTVVSADTGRPVAGARVTVSGQVTANVAAAAAAATSAAAQPGQRAGGDLTVRFVGPGAASTPPSQARGAVSTPTSLSRTVLTDASGAFSFPRLPAGQFTISVSQTQFLSTTYGQTRYGGQGKTLVLADGQQATVRLSMPRGGVITGMVIGPDGDPIRGAQIRAWRVDTSSGFRRLLGTNSASTDDRGIYRMFGLTPGEYFVSATPSPIDLLNSQVMTQSDLIERSIATGTLLPPSAPGMTPTIAVPVTQPSAILAADVSQPPSLPLPTYSPSSMVPSGGSSVTVVAGEEKMGVDVRVQMTLSTTIKGTLTTPLDSGVTLQLSLISEDSSIDSPQAMSTRADPSGSFTFRSVAPGNYTVVALTTPPQPSFSIVNNQPVQSPPPPALTDAQKMWGRTRVTVAGEATIPVSVTLKPALSISGIVNFDMAQRPDLTRSRVIVTLGPAPTPQSIPLGNLPQGQIEPDGRFTLTGVMPGRYVMRTTSSGVLKSAMIGGQDILDFPLELTGDRSVTDAVLTITDQTSELNGSLLDSTGKPAEGCTIVAFAADMRFWRPGSRRIAVTRPGPDGQYTIRNLAAGSYQLAVVLDFEQGTQFDPDFLRSLARASVPVTIASGGKVTQELRVK